MPNGKVQPLTFFERSSTAQNETILMHEVDAKTEHRVTYFAMSCIVALFINVVFGLAAMACSFKSHQLLNKTGRIPGLKQRHGELNISIFIPDNEYRQAKKFGYAAFFFNILGIVTTMVVMIWFLSTR
ncbi:hypothetical protein Ciccas_010659 [Cichlidogyrus casuarinus]|uniref:Uncharacterized protein n=1 Tax=Cichlidogyrus casuarinus TaxID=1844966 RepID=A0ABD2PTH5_9PLAT